MTDTRCHETMLEDAKAHSIESLEAENAKLRAALAPFARFADQADRSQTYDAASGKMVPAFADNERFYTWYAGPTTFVVTFGDLRAVTAALQS